MKFVTNTGIKVEDKLDRISITKTQAEEEEIYKIMMKAEINGRFSVIKELLEIKFKENISGLVNKLSLVNDIFELEDIIKKIMTPHNHTIESIEYALFNSKQHNS